MALRKKFYSVDGRIIGERSTGGGRTNYAADALGSVIGTLKGGVVENTYVYKPYGTRLQKTGIGPDPSFAWVGTFGYRPNMLDDADYYVRARTYSASTARWTSRDPIWPIERAYAYAANGPVTHKDESGLACSSDQGEDCCSWWVKHDPFCTPAASLFCAVNCAAGGYGCIPLGCGHKIGECGFTCYCLVIHTGLAVPMAQANECLDKQRDPEPAPRGRRYQNCWQYKAACYRAWSSLKPRRDYWPYKDSWEEMCYQCFGNCTLNGLNALLNPPCDFWYSSYLGY